MEIYRRTKPDEAATYDAGFNLLTSLYFDHRYDLALVGRYKFNKKLSLSKRISGLIAAETVTDPNTGEILVDEGNTITPEIALAIENSGIEGLYIFDTHGEKFRVLGNRFVDARCHLDFDPDEIGIDELVHYPALMNLLGECRDMSLDERKGFPESEYQRPYYRIIYDDMQHRKLPHGLEPPAPGKIDDIDHLGNGRVRSVGGYYRISSVRAPAGWSAQ